MNAWGLCALWLLPMCGLCGCALMTNLDELRGGEPQDAAPEVTSFSDASVVFLDDFNRANSNQIGNDWLTKSLAFEIANDSLVRLDPDTSIGYLDNLVYRPAAQVIRDVSVSVEVTYVSMANVPYPQIHVRIDPATAPTAGVLDSYLFFPTAGGATGMSIARLHGSAYQIIGAFALDPPLDTNHRFRFTLAATGSTSVSLMGRVEILDQNTWTLTGTTSIVDNDAALIGVAGSVGLSGSNGEATGDYAYDNFTVSAL